MRAMRRNQMRPFNGRKFNGSPLAHVKVGMRTLTFASISASLALVVGCTTVSPQHQHADSKIEAVVSEIDRLRDSLHIPGLSLAILKDEQMVWAGGLGYADVNEHRRADAQTLYPIASLTKPIAATIALQLLEEGKLALDDPLSKYHHDFQSDRVRVRHIMTHTAAAFAPGAKPGDRYEYSGAFYGYLASVIEKASGHSFRDELVERILSPLHMTESVPGHDVLDHPELKQRYAASFANLATPYSNDTVARYPPRFLGSSAGILSTVNDLAKFNLALDRGVLLRPQTLALAWTPARANDGRILPYGLGWFVQQYRGATIVWHYGQWPMFSGLIVKVPERHVTLIALANSDGLSAPFPMADGDVLKSPFARAFLNAFCCDVK